MALGASAPQVRRLVVREVSVIIGIGLALGVIALAAAYVPVRRAPASIR